VLGPGLPGIPRRLWLEAKAASHRLLMFDYDGTLAPFRIARQDARPLPGTVEKLRAIISAGKTRVAVVSGRPIEELHSLLGPLKAHLFGEHGWEEQSPSGRILQIRLPEIARVALDRAVEAASDCEWSARLELKRTAVVLHTRGLAPEDAARIEDECEKRWWFVESAGLRRRRIHGGLELRVCGHDKGTAVRQLFALAPVRPFSVYVGDDETDEDAFGAVRPDGYGIRVGSLPCRSLAAGQLTSCGAVAEFLERWLQVVEGVGDEEN
jgi:trehalose 6-phosphate phosphatase